MNNNLVFDVGMFDGSDTAYYLTRGFRVVAIEANPQYAEKGRKRFARDISSGRLEILNVGVAEHATSMSFFICGEDEGSSSFCLDNLHGRAVRETIQISCTPFSEILCRYGVPYYLKVDIEKMDAVCIKAIQKHDLPYYVSWEAGEDAPELIEHLAGLGFTGFKIINQTNFREIRYIGSFRYRLNRKLRYLMRKPTQHLIPIAGYNFLSEHSTGPMAEETDGKWRASGDALRAFTGMRPEQHTGWYDIHARLGR